MKYDIYRCIYCLLKFIHRVFIYNVEKEQNKSTMLPSAPCRPLSAGIWLNTYHATSLTGYSSQFHQLALRVLDGNHGDGNAVFDRRLRNIPGNDVTNIYIWSQAPFVVRKQ